MLCAPPEDHKHAMISSVMRSIFLLCLVAIVGARQPENSLDSFEYLPATIQIVTLIHPYNKVSYIPHFLGGIESQRYPKSRIRIRIITERIFYSESYDDPKISLDGSTMFRNDHQDNDLLDERIRLNDLTIEMLKRWSRRNRDAYNDIDLSITNVRMPEDAHEESYWNKARYSMIINHKNQELYEAARSWADWLLFCDADVILTDPTMFRNLTQLVDSIPDLVVLAPMLHSFGTYSNFWAGMDDTGYYVRTDDYIPILSRKEHVGTFSVPMVHSCVFINLRKRASRMLTFDPLEVQQHRPKLPYDDIIAFAQSASLNDVPMYVDNRHVWGWIPPSLTEDTFQLESVEQTLLDLELQSMVEGPEFPVATALDQYVREGPDETDTLNVDQVYIVNLARRPERKRRMERCLKKLGIRARFWNATDGKELTETYLRQHGIRSLDGYMDPYHKRPITFGEIGCLLSHYRIWEDAYRNNYSKVIVLEDDVRFDMEFRSQWSNILSRFESLGEYDFLYLGRKALIEYDKEEVVDQLFVRPGYSYWTIGYLITKKGIEKLLRANPTSRMLPVDEFLPIMYGSHTNETLVELYEPIEKLKALSLRHLIVSPTHYVGDPLYISDTEHSIGVTEKNSEPEEDPVEVFDRDGNKIKPATVLRPPANLPQHFEL